MNISVHELTGPHCGEYSDGEKVYQQVYPLLKDEKKVNLDFSGLKLVSSGFFNGSMVPLFQKFEVNFLVSHLMISRMTKIDRYILNRMIKDAERLKEPTMVG